MKMKNHALGKFIKKASEKSWKPTLPFPEDLWESDWPYLTIDFQADFDKMYQECVENDDMFVGHRQKDMHLSYAHEGWKAVTLHGVASDATESHEQYGKSKKDYHWTNACLKFPECYKFLKKLGYSDYDRVRIMKLEPGGYIMPHTDGEGRIFGPLNIAINNPKGCEFYFQDYGKVPFKKGRGVFLDIGNVHAVYNDSDQPRYHFIVHGAVNPKLIDGAWKSLNAKFKLEHELELLREQDSKRTICYGIYNQLDRIDNIPMYLRFKASTLFYLKRGNKDVDIIFGDSIEELLNKSADAGYDYCVVVAAGTALQSFNFDSDIRKFISKDKDFGVAGHILIRPEHWAELHHQYFIVNLLAYKDVGRPNFGEWQGESEELLPVLERSEENFHHDYTPLWVRVNKNEKRKKQPFAGQGWELLKAMFEGDWRCIMLSENLRHNKFYHYPDHDTARYEQSLQTMTSYESQNWNQKKSIDDALSVKDQIWLFNSEDMNIVNEGPFDLVVNTASGFKLFDMFKQKKLNAKAKIVIYDFNPKSLAWYRHLYEWGSTPGFKQDDLGKRHLNLLECMKTFSDKEHFTWIGKNHIPPDEQGDQHDDMTIFKDVSFVKSLKDAVSYFGGSQNFINYWTWFRACDVQFKKIDLYRDTDKFCKLFTGKGRKYVNLSNIFSTDATNLLFGQTEVQCAQQRCLFSLYLIDPDIEVSLSDNWNRFRHGKVKDLVDI
tara:strand:+ start:1156 stop:3309 length:2154 start_codon:yes stop_codon:yes gene_type:complete